MITADLDNSYCKKSHDGHQSLFCCHPFKILIELFAFLRAWDQWQTICTNIYRAWTILTFKEESTNHIRGIRCINESWTWTHLQVKLGPIVFSKVQKQLPLNRDKYSLILRFRQSHGLSKHNAMRYIMVFNSTINYMLA